MQAGLKLWSTDTDLLPEALSHISAGRFCYIELMPVPGTCIDPFQAAGIPCIIHAPGDRFGMNIADRGCRELNHELFAMAAGWADDLSAPALILHPGSGRMEEALRFLDETRDDRVVIENMPRRGIADEPMIGATRDEIRRLRGGRFGFCLDFNHAVKASLSLGLPSRAFIEDLLGEMPVLFHLSDSLLTDDRDEHLPLGAGEYDLRFFRGCISRSGNPRVTMETPRSRRSLEEDLGNLERFTRL
jgi:deoxyribonuclease-4